MADKGRSSPASVKPCPPTQHLWCQLLDCLSIGIFLLRSTGAPLTLKPEEYLSFSFKLKVKVKPVSGFWREFPRYLTWKETVWRFKTNKQSSEDTPRDSLLTWQENPRGDTLQNASQCFPGTQRPVTGGYGLFTEQLQRLQQTEK